MQPGQNFVTAGGFHDKMRGKAWSVAAGQQPQEASEFAGNHEEADTRVWFHASRFKKAIIYSPDTDTFMVGLPLVDQIELCAVVHVDMPGASERKYRDINMLLDHTQRDPDLTVFSQAN